jgi:hypothetical protein
MRKAAVHATSLLILGCAIAAAPAFADRVLYNSGPPPTVDVTAWGIFPYDYPIPPNEPLWVSDSFTLGRASEVDGANFIVFLDPGDALASVDWEISTAPDGGTILASGAMTNLPNTYLGLRDWPGFGPTLQIDAEHLSIPDLQLGPGVFWLTLENATTPLQGPVWWEQASVWSPTGGAYASNEASSIPQETFQILGTAEHRRGHGFGGGEGSPDSGGGLGAPVGASTPEPSGLILLGTGLAALAGIIRLRRRG